MVHTKGAPEEVLARSVAVLEADGSTAVLDDARRTEITAATQRYAAQGPATHRDRGTATSTRTSRSPPTATAAESRLTLTGFVALLDPARPEVRPAVVALPHRRGADHRRDR